MKQLLQNRKDLRNAVSAAFLAASSLSLGACATTPQVGECMKPKGVNLGLVNISNTTYDENCGAQQAARGLISTPNIDSGARAWGMRIIEDTSPVAQRAGNDVRDALANQGTTSYTVRRNADGSATLVGQPVITVEQTARPASPVAAPTPNGP